MQWRNNVIKGQAHKVLVIVVNNTSYESYCFRKAVLFCSYTDILFCAKVVHISGKTKKSNRD